MAKTADPLTVAGQRALEAVVSVTARNVAIREASDAGCSLRAIAEAAQLSVEGVRRIIARTASVT
jgi:hypothetical protein